MIDYSKYTSYFSRDALIAKIGDFASKAGLTVINAALTLYYTAIDPATPLRDKAIIYGALGYFILPLDAIPDAIPIAGFTDDSAALFAAISAVKSNITPEIRAKGYAKTDCRRGRERERINKLSNLRICKTFTNFAMF